MNNYLSGVVPSPQDLRDWKAESIYSVLAIDIPEVYDLRPYLLPIRDQGSQGACSAFSAACIKEYQEYKNVSLDEYMSPQFIYNNRSTYPSAGMYPRDTMQILQNLGCAREKVYQYGKIESKDKITEEVFNDAYNFRIQNYAQVSTIEGLKIALIQNGPCYISVPGYDYGSRMWKPKADSQSIKFYHAMVVVGFNKEGFIIRNSWSESFGEKGYCTLPYEDWGLQSEIWTTIDDNSTIVNPKYDLRGTRVLRTFIGWANSFFKSTEYPFPFIRLAVSSVLIILFLRLLGFSV